MSRVFDTYRKPSVYDTPLYFTITGSPISTAALAAGGRAFADIALLAPLTRPMLLLATSLRLIAAQSPTHAQIQPDDDEVVRIPWSESALVDLWIYPATGTPYKSLNELVLPNAVGNNHLGQHTIPAGGFATITLVKFTLGTPSIDVSYWMPSFSAYIAYGA